MSAEYIQRGEALDFPNTTEATIPVGAVIEMGTRIGVAGDDILPGQVGTVHVMGVFRFPKAESKAPKMGDALYYDKTAKNITTESGETTLPAGYAAAAAAETDTTVLVNIGFPPAAAAAGGAAAASKLADLSDVETSGVSEGYVLKYQSEKWTAVEETKHALKDLTDVDASAPADDNVLTYDQSSAKWKAEAPAGA